MESSQELKDFKRKSVFAICNAGSDRSRYIEEVLSERGYFANHGGVMEGQNYVTTSDLSDIGTIVFASNFEKQIFDKDRRLSGFVKRNGIQTRILHITESDKDRAHNSGGQGIEKLKEEIRRQLDTVGLTKPEN